MTNETKHTPMPWEIGGTLYLQFGDKKSFAAYLANSQEDAAHIVKCVNMHDELVEALKNYVECVDNDRSTSDSYLTAFKIIEKAGAL